MKPLFFALLLASLSGPALAVETPVKEGKIADSGCGPKIALQRIGSLSDVELMRAWVVLLRDPRLLALKDLRDLEVWVQDQNDCDKWSEQNHMSEVKAMLVEVQKRNLRGSLAKAQQGTIRVHGLGESLEEWKDGQWNKWRPSRGQ